VVDISEATAAPDEAGEVGADDVVRRVQANGIEIAYETFGDPADPALLLVMGLGTQMIAWPDEMCDLLAGSGLFVVRYDNRDVGLSTHIDAPAPTIPQMLLRRNTPYQVDDMASDGLGLLDALGIERFHLVGASMGGFISQLMAIRAPQRVRSLTLIMTSTGSRRVGRPTPAVIRRMAAQAEPRTRAEAQDMAVETYGIIGSPAHLDADVVRHLAGVSYDRSNDSDGRSRQLAAILAAPDRTAALRKLTVPTLVVHGLDDPLVAASGGLALAKAIPGATFIGHSGMGHDLPRTLWQELTKDILSLVDRADADAGTTA
jgi:pimeloyl-ACP methyl ester carboxylesterase